MICTECSGGFHVRCSQGDCSCSCNRETVLKARIAELEAWKEHSLMLARSDGEGHKYALTNIEQENRIIELEADRNSWRDQVDDARDMALKAIKEKEDLEGKLKIAVDMIEANKKFYFEIIKDGRLPAESIKIAIDGNVEALGQIRKDKLIGSEPVAE